MPSPPDIATTNGAVTASSGRKNPKTRRRLWVTGLVFFGIAWAIAITYSVTAGGRSPERLSDPQAHTVDAACVDAQHTLAALPQVGAHTSPANRADRVSHEDAILTSMLGKIGALHPTSSAPAAGLRGWLSDWRKLIAARQNYASDLRTEGNTARFVEPATNGVQPIVLRMNNWILEQGTRTDHCNTGELQAEVIEGQRIYGAVSKT